MRFRLVLGGVVSALVLGLVPGGSPPPATAVTPGGVFITCHDPDFHAHLGGNTTGARNVINLGIDYITSGMANPDILLVTSRINPGGGYSDPALGLAAAGRAFTMADDGTAGGPVLNLAAVTLSDFDVVVVASDFGGWLRQGELDILIARSAELISFVNNGGSIYAMAESPNLNGLTFHSPFGFLPFVVSSTDHNQTEAGFTVTPFGASLGLVDADVNGNASHCRFLDTGGLAVVNRDSTGAIMSAAVRGVHVGEAGVPALSVNDVSIVEGNVGTQTVTFTVSLSQVSNDFVSVGIATADGTATSQARASSLGDYIPGSTVLSIAPGTLETTFSVAVRGDKQIEPNETFFVNLSNPANATIDDGQGVGTILNND